MAHVRTPPPPGAVAHLRPTDVTGALVTTTLVAVTATGLALSMRPAWWMWAIGQAVLAAALVEWFIVLHECGHGTLFRNRSANRWVGRVAGLFAIIPFHVWTRVHGRHHKWTGWQDVDPTTATLVRRDLAAWERIVVNVCWRCWIPIFAVLYRLNNFWHVPRLRRLFPPGELRPLVVSIAGLLALYVGVVAAVGAPALLRWFGLALVAAFVIEDLLLISQHTHLPMTVSGGHDVPPYPARDQERFTRSMRFPRPISAAALHFDAHELHHMYPAVPGYRLGEVPYVADHEVPAGTWVPAARAVPGAVLLFQSRNESGFDV